jgi:thiamine biosynthesis lipoprotein ApbE
VTRYASASFDAIGVENRVVVRDPAALAAALDIARSEVRSLDLACSRFRDDSELAAVNAGAGQPVAVGGLLLAALQGALWAAAATDGLVDPTVGAALRGLGYDRDFDVVVRGPSAPSFTLVPATGWRSVAVDAVRRTVRVPRGTELDLGATAKAFAADRIARIVRRETASDVLVSLGGDVAVCGAPDGGWPVRIADAAADGPTVAIAVGGLATSSTARRRWRAGGRELHHIVDPATGVPAAEHWRTVSVAASSCLDANAAATAAIVKGAAAVSWLERLGLPSRLVRADGAVATTCGWPAAAR